MFIHLSYMYVVTLFLLFFMWYENWGFNNHRSGEPDPEAGSRKTLECKCLIKEGLKPKAERGSLQTKNIFY